MEGEREGSNQNSATEVKERKNFKTYNVKKQTKTKNNQPYNVSHHL